MKPNFALHFSHDGLVLLHRTGSDWSAIGEVSLADPDLTEALVRLRRSALALEPKGILSKLIIPASQILYTDIRAPGPDAASRRSQIAKALEGRTPYEVPDLVFDWSGRGDIVQVAVVARETLAEAEAFADLYGFCPVSFVASPEPGQFAAEPFFGLTSTAAQHLPEGNRLDRDQDPVRVHALAIAEARAEPDPDPPVLAEVAVPEPEPEPLLEPEPEADTAPAPATEAATAPPPEATAGILDAPPEATMPLADPEPEVLPEPAPESRQEPEALPDPEPPPLPAEISAAPEPEEAPFVDLTQENDPGADLPRLLVPAAAAAAPVFASRRSGDGPAAPRIGGAAPEAAPARKLPGATIPRVLDPGIDLPDPETAAVARSLAGVRERAKAHAVPAGRKPLAAAGRKAAPAAKPVHRQEPAAAADRTVFGAHRLDPGPRRPRHLWLVLTAALLLFMLVVAIWASFLDTPPPEVAAPAAPPLETTEAAPAPEPPPAAEPPPPAQITPAPATPEPADTAAVWGERAALDTGLSFAAMSSSAPLAGQERSMGVTLATPLADAQPAPPPLPAPFAQLARLGPGGEITPTASGVAMPGGFTLFAGRPPIVSVPRPEAIAAIAQPTTEPPVTEPAAAAATADPAAAPAPYADPALADFAPRARPADLAPTDPTPANPAPADPVPADPAQADEDGATLTPLPVPADPTLANRKPRNRPAGIDRAAAQAAATRLAEEQAAAEAQAAMASATAQAVTESRRPPGRPGNLVPVAAAASPVAAAAVEAAVAAAVRTPEPPARAAPKAAAREPEEEDEPETPSAMPKLPTSASVAKQATQTNVLNLGKINLIGLYGTPKNRRALVRMPNGKFVKVGVGDRLDGGKVTAIGSNKLTYQKGSRALTLDLLKGG